MSKEDTRPPMEFLYESLVIQAYAHSKFVDEVDLPEKKINNENTQDMEHDISKDGALKEHPIAKNVYFSGVAEVNNLPHQSPEAIKQYLEFQLRLKNELQKKFNPKPNVT
ncbi:MAG: hypothetical protein HRT87_04245 [Legionellales bacterium]|nr:hypothetical protein [Legionellales bacterium]